MVSWRDLFGRPVLLLPICLIALAGCKPAPSSVQSQTVKGVTFDYGLTSSPAVAAYPASDSEAQMHGGPPPTAYHVTLAVFDAKTRTRIRDAKVTLQLSGPGHPGHVVMPLDPMVIHGDTTYGGYVALPKAATYNLTFKVVRRDQPHGSVEARFAYDRVG